MSASSYVDQDGEWKFRKITLMGVVRSFVTQLRPGQDLTRVSLPAVLLHPYSILEVVGYRELTYFETLLELNKEEDPLKRFMIVLRWILCTIQQETFHKKPYNPVLGETHECHIQSEQYGRSEFIAEQVSHHPPISAFVCTNSEENVSLSGNISFNVKFGGNHVNVVTEGPMMVNVEDREEQYELSKCLPDMMVKNVVWGTKRIFWNGDLTITCPKTGYTVQLTFKESGTDNVVRGVICNMYTPEQGDLFTVEGRAGGVINIVNNKTKEKKLFLDVEALVRPKIQYQNRVEMDPLASLAVWENVSKYIIENDMEKADEAKKKIEQDQRVRVQEKKTNGTEHSAKYFQGSEFGWVFKGLSRKPDDSYNSEDMDSDSEEDLRPDEHNKQEEKKEIRKDEKRPETPESIDRLGRKEEKDNKRASVHLEDRVVDKDRRSASPATDRRSSNANDDKLRTGGMHTEDDRDIPAIDRERSPRIGKSHSLTEHRLSSNLRSSVDINNNSHPGKKEVDTNHEDEDKKGGSMRWTNPVRIGIRAFRKDNAKDDSLTKEEKKRIREESRRTNNPSTRPSYLPGPFYFQTGETTVMAGWIKMRNSMKIWVNRYFVLRPGKLIYYRDDKEVAKDRCQGILRLAHCKAKPRDNVGKQVDGFPFKVYHLLRYPIYHKYGLRGETLKLAMLPVSWSYCVLKVGTIQERKAWMDAITEQIAYANEHDHSGASMLDMEEDDDIFSDDDNEKVFSSPEPEKDEKLISDVEKELHVPMGQSISVDAVIEQPRKERRKTSKSSGKKSKKIDSDVIAARELPEELFFEQNNNNNNNGNIDSITLKTIQKQTNKSLDSFKKEFDMRMFAMEKRITQTIQTGAKPISSKKISFGYIQFFFIILVAMVLGRYTQSLV